MAKAARARRSPTARRKVAARAAAGDAAQPLVLYIHGVGRHKPADELKAEWDLALFGSDRGDATRMAYWSDIVHPPATGGKRSKRGTRTADEPSADVADAALKEAGVSSKAAGDYAEAIAAMLGAPAGRTRGPGKKVLPLPRFLRKPVSAAFLKAFIGDTAAYFFDKEKRRRIRERFQAVVPDDGRPLTIVAHSQGSIVALEVLAALGASVNVVKLVTIGSPLGLQEVQDFLDVLPGRKPFDIPGGVEQWHNFADPLDPVALDKGLRGEFGRPRDANPPRPLIVDELVVNDGTRKLIGFNPHSAIGYLAHPKVRRSVHEGAQFDSMARFVVARDVAEGLAVEGRQPVIIELLEPGYWALGERGPELEAREDRERRAHGEITLADRVERAAAQIGEVVRTMARAEGRSPDQAEADARIDPLRRFVAARLTPDEVRQVAVEHKTFNVYAVWRSSSKKKLIARSQAVLQVDAARGSYGARGGGIVWAVLDTGVRSDHAHFKNGTIQAVWDCTQRGAPKRLTSDTDRDGHGSHVSGIIAGESRHKGTAYAGMAPDTRLVVYKVLDDNGQGEDAWIIKALDHIARQNENAAGQVIHGINLSLGGPYDSTVYGCGFTPICQELRRQWRAGVVVVVACGNEGQLDVQTSDGEVEINTSMSIGDPANLEDCIAVGSVNADKPHLYGVSPFSSRGPTSDGRLKPDVVAPGERIMSVNSRSKTEYRVESGTSMAAPHVSGMLAAFLSARREFRGRPDDVKRILMDACTDIGRDRYHQGRGVPNLMKMLLSV
ncbi:MAG: S8 family peptidase [Vicinamibacterales bacterium]